MRAVHWILLALAVFGSAFVVLVATSTPTGSPLTRTIGACLMLLVTVCVVIARYQLGHAFSITPQARRLVTTGLYVRIRNPIYVASPLYVVGLAFLIAQWWPLLLLIAIVPIQVVRAGREETVLRAAFGDAYDRYRTQTWF
ncbi:MAG: isoprenylcysteine carboxylmethyltransferase family protein [Granulicella sp.]